MYKKWLMIIVIGILSLSGFVVWRLFFKPVRTNLIDRRDTNVNTIKTSSAQEPWKLYPIASKLSGKIVFAANPEGQFDLYLLEQGKISRLTHTDAHESYPRWSPDGEKIAFQRRPKGQGQWDIWVYDLNLRKEIPVSTSRYSEENPAWCNGGSTLIFDSDAAPRRQLFRYNFKTGTLEQLTSGRISKNILASCHPADRTIALTSNQWWGWSLGLLDPDTHQMKMLVRGHSCRPEWSPDGKNLAFVYMGWDDKGDIALYDFQSEKPVNLTPQRNETYDYDPAWSPDGQWIIFQSTTNKEKGNWDILVIHVASGQIYPLLGGGPLETYPHWAP